MKGLAQGLAVTLFVLLLPSAWLYLSPDPSAARVRTMLGLVPDPEGPGYTFLQRGGNGDPVGWDPCREITYVVDPTGAPDDWEPLVDGAVQRIADASGLRFRDEGTTRDRDFGRTPGLFERRPPVLIAWSDAEEHPPLEGDVAGVGGSTAVGTGNGARYVTGSVVIDGPDTEDLEDSPGGRAALEALLVHELGHVVGLGHPDDPTQLMYAETTGLTDLGEGDREGLQILGELPCG